MKTFTKLAVTSLFLACASTGYAGGGVRDDPLCIPVDGTVTATPIGCELIPDIYHELCTKRDNTCLGICLSISGKGKAKIKGDESFSVLTTVPVVSSGSVTAGTPLGFPTDPNRAGLSIFTSSASLTGKLETGRQGTLYKGSLYTQDTGVITIPEFDGQPQIVGQILKIVEGTEDFEGATGTISVAGQEVGVGGAAFYTGEICVKRKK